MGTLAAARRVLVALVSMGTLASGCGDGQGSGGGGADGTEDGGSRGDGAASSAGGRGGEAAQGGGGASPSGGNGAGGEATVSCADLPLCDDFESVDVGAPPDASMWAIVSPNCAGTGTLEVTDAQAHSGTRSIQVNGQGGYCNHVFFANTSAPGSIDGPLHARFFVRFADAFDAGHTTFLAMNDVADADTDLRMGGQNGVLMFNRESDDATLPAMSPTGVGLSLPPEPGAWYCVQIEIDGAAGTIRTLVDGEEVAGLQADGTETPDVDQQWIQSGADFHPDLTDFKLGWESYAGQAMTLWFDDVAVGPASILCE